MTAPAEDPRLIEALADIEHARWAHWQRYLHASCIQHADGSLTIPAHLVTRWERQIQLPYSELSEDEKQSDREQVIRYLPLLRSAFQRTPD